MRMDDCHTVVDALAITGLADDVSSQLRLIPWPAVRAEVEAAARRLQEINIPDANATAWKIFAGKSWTSFDDAIDALEAFDVWVALHGPDISENELRQHEAALRANKAVSSLLGITEGSTEPLDLLRANFLCPTTRFDRFDGADFRQLAFAYNALSGLQKTFDDKMASMVWEEVFQHPDEVLMLVEGWGRSRVGRQQGNYLLTEDRLDQWGQRALHALKQSDVFKKGLREDGTEEAVWHWMSAFEFASYLAGSHPWGTSFGFGCAASPSIVAQVCGTTSARVMVVEGATLWDNHPAAREVVCELPQAIRLARAGWPLSLICPLDEHERQRVAEDTGPLFEPGPWMRCTAT